MDSSAEAPPLGKYLASSDKSTRDKAVKNLALFLSNRSEPLPKHELTKLWKGLFYCFWMSDKPLVQQALASELAELLLTVTNTQASLAFLEGFWEVTVREWSGIDRLRLDKYYMLIRRFTNASLRLLIKTEWQADTCSQYNKIISDSNRPLCPNDHRVPTSLAYHLSDIYLEELNKVVKVTSNCPPVPLISLLQPFLNLAAQTTSNITYKRIQSSLFEPLLSDLAVAGGTNEENQNRKRKRDQLDSELNFEALISNSRKAGSLETAQDLHELRNAVYQAIFDVASKEDTRDSNRRKLYAIWKAGLEDGSTLSKMDAS